MTKRRFVVAGGIVLICTAALCLVFSHRILWSLGAILTDSQAPQKADMIVVIGGDARGSRILTAAELVRKGYAPKVLVSGVGDFYGHHESELAVDFAVRSGYPRDIFVPFHYPALSTTDEAQADIDELRKRGAHSYLLVTSVYHSARASRIFRRKAPDLEMHSVPAPERYWENGEWWKYREGRKLWFMEVVKTIAGYLGI